MARDPVLTASGDVWVGTSVCKPEAAHPGINVRKTMLTLFVYSRPGWLPDRQLLLGGMLLPLSTRVLVLAELKTIRPYRRFQDADDAD
jgi:hypothetical protein